MKINEETLSGDKSLSVNDATVQLLDGQTDDRNVELPATANKGLLFEVVNAGGSNALAVKSGASTIATLAAGKAATVICDGSTWASTGIRAAD